MNDTSQSPQPAPLSREELIKRLKGIDKVVVAIHGIGNQTRGSTIRQVAAQFGERSEKPRPLLPLGFFHFGPGVATYVSRFPEDPGDDLHRIGFVEVFWADIPRGVAAANDTLEETKAWAKTIVSQAHSLYEDKRGAVWKGETDSKEGKAAANAACKKAGLTLRDQDFALASGVVDEIVETIAVLERLSTVLDKAGLFKFDLGPLLRDFVGDVQVVAEFEQYRDEIVFCFHRVMAHIEQKFGECNFDVPKIYIVAHSEGTVVSFLGLLEGLKRVNSREPLVKNPKPKPGEPEAVGTSWINHVKGYMTIGSPIDKHIVLWRRLWEPFHGKLQDVRAERIQWRNYYDFGDPVGFKLNTARDFLSDEGCTAFEFDEDHDFGFSRYPLPGKAHNDYWEDKAVFGHFIDDVVNRDASKPAPKPAAPPNKWLSRAISWVLPYALVYLLHVGAMYALFKGVSAFWKTKPEIGTLAHELFILGAFVNLVTIAARVPRLTRGLGARWPAFAVSFAFGLLCIWLLGASAPYVGEGVQNWTSASISADTLGRYTIGLVGLAVALTPLLIPRKRRAGRKVLVTVGGLLALGVIVANYWLGVRGSVALWPAVLGFAAFIYVWWLGILLFDLVFVWNRYIRQSIAVDSLRKWYPRNPVGGYK